jgi:hypothetical protein
LFLGTDSRIGQTKTSEVLKNPTVIPLISLVDPRSWIQLHASLESLVVPFYEVWGGGAHQTNIEHRDIHEVLSSNRPIGLSSIGPDDYVMSEAYFIDFLQFALGHGFDYVLAWDTPTYVDMPAKISWNNTVYGIEQVGRAIKAGLSVVGLLNGSNKEQYEKCAVMLKSMGIEEVAIHVSEYLRYRRDSLLMGLMWDALKIAYSQFPRTLIIGATDPFLIRYPLKEACPESSVSGLSWFIDAKHGIVYGAQGKVNAYEKDILCSCPSCKKGQWGSLSRSTLRRAIHNFSVVQGAMAGSGFPQVESVDIIYSKQKIALVSCLHLGTKESLVFDFCEAMREEKPEILLFLGDTFEIMASDFALLEEHAKAFFNLIYELGCEVFPVYGGTDKSLSALNEQLKRIAYDHEVHPNVNFTKFLFRDEYQHLYHIFKFYIAARESISIRSAKGKRLYAAYGPTLNFEMPSIERADEILKERRCDCLVLVGYHRKSIDKDRFYSLGTWRAPTREQEGSKREIDLRDALIIDGKGIVYKKFEY